MTRDGGKNRDQIEFTSLDELVPEDHLVRKLENAIDWRPVVQYMFGIRSMRQTIQEIKVNTAYRWFLGLGLRDPVPHFSTFGKNYMRRFKDSDLFEQIFQKILKECMEAGLVDESVVFVDSTHVKARANSKKYEDAVVEEQALWYEKELRNSRTMTRSRSRRRTAAKGNRIQTPPRRKKPGKRKKSTSSRAPATRKAAGSARENTRTYLPTACRPPATSIVSSSDTASTPATKTMARPSPAYTKRSSI